LTRGGKAVKGKERGEKVEEEGGGEGRNIFVSRLMVIIVVVN